MILILCDKCGADCERNAYEIRVSPIHNPCPLYATDVGDLKISDEHKKFRFILCQDCYREMGFPNYYKAVDADPNEPLIFRERED